MPKAAAARQPRRLAPYDLRMAPSISTPITSYLPAMSHTAAEWQPTRMYPTPSMHHPMGETMNPIASSHHQLPQPSSPPQPAQSGPWSTEEDDLLFHARSQSLSWGQIQEQFFPTKSANACRKRYERLNVKRRSNDWDDARLDRLALAYVDMRAQLWLPLAERLGEKWEHVEKACMQQGLKSLRNLSAQHRRTVSNGSSRLSGGSASEADVFYSTHDQDETDDSGIGIGVSSALHPSSTGPPLPAAWPEPVLLPPLHHCHHHQHHQGRE